jgi:hypothetical protein
MKNASKNNYAIENSDTRKPNPPIKIVDKTTKTPKMAVVKGEGISAIVAAMPIFKYGKREHPKRAWKCLLDSGSDGDLILIKKKDLQNIPTTKRYLPLNWNTSNGTFKTKEVGTLDVKFPTYSGSKYFGITPDIIEIDDDAEEPMFNLILGVETLANLGVILDFSRKTIIVDHISNPMQPIQAFESKRMLFQIAQEEKLFPRPALEPISTREATKRAV